MSNLILDGIQQIDALLHPLPSKSYIARFCIQVAFSSILLTLCVIYLVLTYIESRRTSKPLALLRIQRVPSGRFIVVNALVLLVLFNAVAALLMLALRCKVYTIYYGGKIPFNRLVLAVFSWLPLALVAWAYSFGNIAAMMQIKTRDYGGPSRKAIVAYNSAFFAILVAIFGIALPCCILANRKMNLLLHSAQNLLVILQDKSKSPILNISPTELQTIQDLQETIAASSKRSLVWVRIVLAVGAGISFLTAISAGSAFWFVAFLSKFPNQERIESGIRSPSPPCPFEQDHEITFLGLGAVPLDRPPTSGRRASKSPSTVTSRAVQNIALERLHKDLRLSVPIVLILSVYCMVIAILTGFHLGDPEWKELTDDGMAWTSPVLIIIVVAFLHNLIKYRHSKSLTSPSHLEQQQHHQAIRLSRTPSISPRTAFFGTFSNNLQDTKVDLPVKDEDEEGQIDASEQMERKRSLAGLGISVIENPQFRFNDDSYGRIATEAKEGRRLPLT